MTKFVLIFTLLFFNPFASLYAKDNTLTLVYKDIGKPPYMQAAPDNSGLYLDMMKRAAQKIGFDLKVIRQPKKRTYKLLKDGNADLYASGEFRDYRSKFLFYFPNGLSRVEHYYGLTSDNIPELTDISQIIRYKLIWMVELGSSWPLHAKSLGLQYTEMKNAGINKAIEISQLKRSTFFMIEDKDVYKYMEKNKISSFKELKIKVHKNCCKSKHAPLYTGFSRYSPYYKEEPNLLYDKTKPLSQTNFPYKLSPKSVAYKFKNALKQMIKSGEIERMKSSYSIK